MCLSCRTCARPSSTSSSVTSVTRGRLDDAPDEQQRRQHHADLDGDRQVGEHRQRERHEPDGDVGRSSACSSSGISRHSPMLHATTMQDGRKNGHRDVRARAARRTSRTRSSVSAWTMPGDRRLRARADVGGGARDRAGRGQAAERAATRCWRRPARTARRSGCGDRRSCDRRRRPTSATRSRRASRPSAPARSAAGSDPAGTAALEAAAARTGCRRSAIRWSRSAGRTTATRQRAGDERDDRRRHAACHCAASRAISSSGVRTPMPVAVDRDEVACSRQHVHPADEVAGHRGDLQAEEVLELRAGDEERDAVGEADDDRARDEPDRRCRARWPRSTSITPAIIVHMNRPSTPCFGDDAGDDDDERAGRPADLGARSAERRDRKPVTMRAVDAGLGRQPGRDGERHRQRQRDEADGDARDQVADEGARSCSAAGT